MKSVKYLLYILYFAFSSCPAKADNFIGTKQFYCYKPDELEAGNPTVMVYFQLEISSQGDQDCKIQVAGQLSYSTKRCRFTVVNWDRQEDFGNIVGQSNSADTEFDAFRLTPIERLLLRKDTSNMAYASNYILSTSSKGKLMNKMYCGGLQPESMYGNLR